MSDLELTDEQRAFLRWVRSKGELVAEMTIEAYYRGVLGRPVKDFHVLGDQIDALERYGLIELVTAKGRAAEYRLTPHGARLLDG
jgi:hypothetical protein